MVAGVGEYVISGRYVRSMQSTFQSDDIQRKKVTLSPGDAIGRKSREELWNGLVKSLDYKSKFIKVELSVVT